MDKLYSYSSSSYNTSNRSYRNSINSNYNYTNFCLYSQCLTPLTPHDMKAHLAKHKNNGTFPEIETIDEVNILCEDMIKDALVKIQDQRVKYSNQLDIQKLRSLSQSDDILAKLNQSKSKILMIIDDYFENIERQLIQKISESKKALSEHIKKGEIVINQMHSYSDQAENMLAKLRLFDTNINALKTIMSHDFKHYQNNFQNEWQIVKTALENEKIDILINDAALENIKIQIGNYISFDYTKVETAFRLSNVNDITYTPISYNDLYKEPKVFANAIDFQSQKFVNTNTQASITSGLDSQIFNSNKITTQDSSIKTIEGYKYSYLKPIEKIGTYIKKPDTSLCFNVIEAINADPKPIETTILTAKNVSMLTTGKLDTLNLNKNYTISNNIDFLYQDLFNDKKQHLTETLSADDADKYQSYQSMNQKNNYTEDYFTKERYSVPIEYGVNTQTLEVNDDITINK